jgi:Gelsolin repeat
VKEVPLAASSLTQGDVYILDAALKIYIFCGPTANMFEKNKGKRRTAVELRRPTQCSDIV